MSDVRARPLERYGNFLFHHRNVLFPAVLLALFIGFRPQYPRGSEQLDIVMDVVGVMIALGGQALRIAVIGYAYIVRGGRNQRLYAEDLVTRGVFAQSRNPLYLGNLLVLLGLFVIHNNPWVYALGLAFFGLSYTAIVAAEEEYLSAKFGDAYIAYTRRVPRWLPRLRGLGQSLSALRFNWRRVLLKEYGSTYAWTTGAIALMTTETLAHDSYVERSSYLRVLWLSWGLLTLCWATTRHLKKSRRLREANAP